MTDQTLPPEVWSVIFDLVTHVPRELGIAEWTGNYDILELGRCFISELPIDSDSLRKAIQFRLKLSLVSRMWYRLMQRILYQSIVIDSPRRMQTFHRLITSFPEIAVLVKRFDATYIYGQHAVRLAVIFSQIVQPCANLLLLVDGTYVHHPARKSLFQHLPRRVDYTLSNACIQQVSCPLDSFTELPPNNPLPHLRLLYLPIGSSIISTDTPPFSLPRLEMLNLPDVFSTRPDTDKLLARSHFPSLHSIVLRIGYTTISSQSSDNKRFWKKFGPRLRSLYIVDLFRGTKDIEHYDILQYIMQDLTNLEQIILPVNTPGSALDLLRDSNAAQKIRIICVCWDCYIHTTQPSTTSSSLLQSVRDFTMFSSFPNLQEFHIIRIPYAGGRALVHKDNREIMDLIGFLDGYERSICSSGISISMTLSNGQVLKSSAELKELYG